MPTRRAAKLTTRSTVGLVIVVLLVGVVQQRSVVAEPSPDEGFAPVAPAAAIQAAMLANLKIVRDWLNDQDFASAAEAAQGLTLLADVYQYQSVRPEWRERTASLRDVCLQLISDAKAKDAAACQKTADECSSLLRDFEQPPASEKVVERNFKPARSIKALMKLMDGTYTDAKTAKTAAELEYLAYTLAEGTNIAQHHRGDTRWRQAALDAREAALRVASKAHGNDLAGGRSELKTVYSRCEACHQGFKK